MEFWASVAFLDTDQLVDVARLCDQAGYAGVTVSDHIFFPARLESKYPYSPDGSPIWSRSTPWPDPWVLIGAMSSATQRLKFATSIYIAPARHPVLVAKQVGTAAVLSHDRVLLGLAPGWMKEEFDVLGLDYANRGKRLDELCEILRLLWKGGMQAYHGTYYDFDAIEISPVPGRPIPLIAGGHSDVALRRAARLDGWIGNAYPPDEAGALLDKLAANRREASTDQRDDYQIIIGLQAKPEADLYRRFEDKGVTGMLCAPWMIGGGTPGGGTPGRGTPGGSLDDKRVAIERFAEHVVAKFS